MFRFLLLVLMPLLATDAAAQGAIPHPDFERGAGPGGRNRIFGDVATTWLDDGTHPVTVNSTDDDQLYADHHRLITAKAGIGYRSDST